MARLKNGRFHRIVITRLFPVNNLPSIGAKQYKTITILKLEAMVDYSSVGSCRQGRQIYGQNTVKSGISSHFFHVTKYPLRSLYYIFADDKIRDGKRRCCGCQGKS
jgi:hypothetical protein